ncbi:hypothetical protein DHW03_19085 [Pedobacter yonginense]|uniref:Lipoprotein n=1 Tax=Pedobacter yonginense TaxID=651869 RepID=A0A317EIK7_9SPHI|nr:hypothetical protein [Pedobacter yonginense]PWS25939.1 hypothetical protein DHW03_19085 [Pedobacter yonginense]
MKKILFVLMLGLGACTSENKQTSVVTDTTTVIKNVDTIKKDTVKVAPVKEKSIEQKADDRLDNIMKKRKSVK